MGGSPGGESGVTAVRQGAKEKRRGGGSGAKIVKSGRKSTVPAGLAWRCAQADVRNENTLGSVGSEWNSCGVGVPTLEKQKRPTQDEVHRQKAERCRKVKTDNTRNRLRHVRIRPPSTAFFSAFSLSLSLSLSKLQHLTERGALHGYYP